jgi:hypothetical protein
MVDRDLEAFASFLSDEAVFFAGTKALRCKPACNSDQVDGVIGVQN